MAKNDSEYLIGTQHYLAKDTLTSRKIEIWLPPLLLKNQKLFSTTDLRHRFLLGGLPSFFTAREIPEKYFQEWIDAY